MASQLMEALQALAHEKKIDEFYLIERLEASLAKSYQNILDLEWDARVTHRPHPRARFMSTSSFRLASLTRRPANTPSSKSATLLPKA